jgi:hypothetical protein
LLRDDATNDNAQQYCPPGVKSFDGRAADTASTRRAHYKLFLRGEGFLPEAAMDVIDGGLGVPPEPNWRAIFGRAADRDAAAEYWRTLITELRGVEKLATANAHSIKRLVVAYVTFDISAKEVLRSGPVMKAKKTGVPTYNPWWTTMSNASSQAAVLEKELCISLRDRGAGAKVERKARKTTGAAAYLKPVGK